MKSALKGDTLMYMEVDFPKLEKQILKRWRREKTFAKSVARRKNSPSFVFYEGPPTANGKPGLHHVESRAFKDVVLRYKTMRGFFVPRRAGWDTHGLPVELEVEKQLGLKSKKDIEKYGIAKFNAECRKSVWKYQKEWEELTERTGMWLNMQDAYVTYETPYIETLWQIIKTWWQKGLLYKDYKVVPFCIRCGTALSSHELAQGYKTVKDLSVYAKFRVIQKEFLQKYNLPKDTYILAWTTTPWTLPGNVALAVGKDIQYIAVEISDASRTIANNREVVILAKNILKKETVVQKPWIALADLKGKDLLNVQYEPLYGSLVKEPERKHYVVSADFVSTEDGTGVVHTAVMYGEDDYALGQEFSLPKRHTVTEEGKFNELVPKWKGKFVQDVGSLIIQDLKKRNLLFKEELYEHEYPFCWRCSTPLLYYAKESWFVNMQKVKSRLLANNRKVNWIPSHLKEGRMGEWLKEVKDWAFSRERYWGTPLPIWECTKCEEKDVIGSIKELFSKKLSQNPYKGKKEIDLHRPFIDKVEFPCKKCKGTMKRIKEVVDVWYDSGAMPFAQNHWMGEKKPKEFPADYIVEAIDQTRGWFYTLLAVSTLLGHGIPYKNVISLGHILDEHGDKMSKSKGNIVDPWEMIDKYGVDAIRWYFYTASNPGDSKLFVERDLQQAVRGFLLPLWNSYMFYEMYADKQSLGKNAGVPKPGLGKNVLDRWIVSRLNTTTADMTKKMDDYDITGAARSLESFVIDDLSLWYIRRSRNRFQNPKSKKELQDAVSTLGYVLSQASLLSAPFIPFLSEVVFEKSKGKGSVHLKDWPFNSAAKRGLAQGKPHVNKKLEEAMKAVREIASKGLALRAKAGLRVRQPLASLKIQQKGGQTPLGGSDPL